MSFFFCAGLNHLRSPLSVREKFAVSNGELVSACQELKETGDLEEALILSTCNRVEVYGVSRGSGSLAALGEGLFGFLAGRNGLGAGEAAKHSPEMYKKRGREAMLHLFAVASGIDSMLLGETEILGQLKKAYEASFRANSLGKFTHFFFQRAFQVAKKVRSSTSIQKGATSIGSVTARLAGRVFGALPGCGILILGAGEAARLAARGLVSRGAGEIFVCNRDFERARRFARQINGTPLPFQEWESRLSRTDILISGVSSSRPILWKSKLEELRRPAAAPRRLFLIDIAAPRNIDPEVGRLEGVSLCDLDSLQSLAGDARNGRRETVLLCREIIRQEAATFWADYLGRFRERSRVASSKAC